MLHLWILLAILSTSDKNIVEANQVPKDEKYHDCFNGIESNLDRDVFGTDENDIFIKEDNIKKGSFSLMFESLLRS